jgi:hypothetical protein
MDLKAKLATPLLALVLAAGVMPGVSVSTALADEGISTASTTEEVD